MAEGLDAVAERLFTGVMAPLVVGGSIEPGHAIGAERALALGDRPVTGAPDVVSRAELGRLRRARRLVPVDVLPGPRKADWALCAALHDLLQSANPTFDTALRRAAAERILDMAIATIDCVAIPATAGDALSRHTWLGRFLEIARTDSTVSWWIGSSTFRGVEPPQRLQAWPEVRRVTVLRTPKVLLDLEPLAVSRAKWTDGVSRLLTRTPLTDLATCTRPALPFCWSAPTLALVSTAVGRTLALRALGRLGVMEVDEALGRATRGLLSTELRGLAPRVAPLLSERALLAAQMPDGSSRAVSPDAKLARTIGARAASRALTLDPNGWSPEERQRLLGALSPAARAPLEAGALALLGLPPAS